ncbi:fused PTS fructose transporter subunit IIA/HPr protein [Psittacicella gerlachiana]|uniref:Uncharacterized protein n=1 Tax=Psittacicella gerlachiana TaxID=2028574 RepID=A0A3A1YHF7_9GAMM|nr:fused PTS fructose transporter subunit IIA/HPr protein [Psittacicella gerlachiana]RIY37125.1 hypothetical protein CKF59_02015 [Psittacicella gerlachiana]
MLNINENDVLLNQKAANKEDAIRIVAKVLANNGHVDPAYVDGMLERETQTSTYLDNGVAIPHGTTKTRDLVKTTGVAVVQFPEGVVWNEDGDKTYIAFGIAASSNEHLPILKAITNIIGEEEEAQALAKATTPEQLLKLIKGDKQVATASNLPLTSTALIDVEAHATEIAGLLALNAANLLAAGYVSPEYFTNALKFAPIHLGSGLWLSSATEGAKANGLALVRPTSAVTCNGKPVKALVNLVFTDQGNAQCLATLVNQAQTLATADLASVLAVFGLSAPAAPAISAQTLAIKKTKAPATAPAATNEDAADSVTATFVIHNQNGLHARPSTELVRVCKQFKSEIMVENLTSGSAPVKAKSMVRVTGLGATKGSELRFVARGEDAAQAIEAIGKAIANGLGE